MKGHSPWMHMITIGIVLVVIEIASYIAALAMLREGLIVRSPDTSGYEDYLANRDPILGWPAPASFGQREIDVTGSRIVPAFPDVGASSCVALFGDSFTWGEEVSAEESYGNVLSQLLNCRVSNYGVGGYGTDQAVIRYLHVIEDSAPVVVLGHFSDNIVRNVNQLRDFIAGGRFGFKPRFAYRSGKLELIPLPTLSEQEYRSVLFNSDQFLPYEFFRPNTKGGAAVMSFPFSRAVVSALFHYRVSAMLRGIRPTYLEFYRPEHPSNALRVTAELILEAANVADARNQDMFVLLIPDIHDLRAVRSGTPASYAPLAAVLESAGANVIDAAEYLMMAFGSDDFCQLYVRCESSHFNALGYRLLAESVYRHINPAVSNFH